jgi:hypothetical protein
MKTNKTRERSSPKNKASTHCENSKLKMMKTREAGEKNFKIIFSIIHNNKKLY